MKIVWNAIETTSDRAAEAIWRQSLGEMFDKLAVSFGWLHRTTPVTEVKEWELNLGKLCRDVAGAFGLLPNTEDVGLNRTRRVALYEGVPIILTIQPDQGSFLKIVRQLVQLLPGKLILLAPTSRFADDESQKLLKQAGAVFIDLESNLRVWPSGNLQATKTGKELFSSCLQSISEVESNDKLRRAKKIVRGTKAVSGKSSVKTKKTTKQDDTQGLKRVYSLRKQLGVWELVFEGRKALIGDERGVQIVAYLLRNPPSEPVHAVPLETKVWARDWEDAPVFNRESRNLAEGRNIEGVEDDLPKWQASGERLNKGENTILKKKVQELFETIDDTTLPQGERDAAQTELDAIHRSLNGAAGKVIDNASKAAERVRKALKRLHEKLANAKDEKHKPNNVLRDFAQHLNKYLLIPSSRFNKGKGSRNRAGVAGTFTYEPPPGVVWKD